MTETLNLFGNDLFGDRIEPPSRGKLADLFTVPPFSVLNAREGHWQDRKRAWLAMGIRGEVGRIAGRAGAGVNQWAKKTEGISGGCQGFDDDYVSVFDPVVCELVYRWFCPPDGLVLDPFAGGSVRGIVAHMLDRRYWGCDLRPEQIAANEEQAATMALDPRPTWVCADALDAVPTAPAADLVFTCPPYGDLERYSDHPRDLSAMPHEVFMAAYGRIILRACERLKQDRFAAIVVGDFRDKRGHYRNFVSDTIAAFQSAGLHMYNEAILVTTTGSLQMRVRRFFEVSRKLGKTHQNLLVFVKGDPRKATAAIVGQP